MKHLFICGNKYLLINNFDLLYKSFESIKRTNKLELHFVTSTEYYEDITQIDNKQYLDLRTYKNNLEKLKELEVNIHYKTSGLHDFFLTQDVTSLQMATGAFLRFEVPKLCLELGIKGTVLYTDYDVFFLQNIKDVFNIKTKIIACAREFHMTQGVYNTGIMLINIDGFKEHYEKLLQYSKEHFEECKKTSWDQYIINKFFEGQIDELPTEYNWKPYWGPNYNAKILHWHGIKPFHLKNENIILNNESLKAIYNKDYYTYWNKVYSEIK